MHLTDPLAHYVGKSNTASVLMVGVVRIFIDASGRSTLSSEAALITATSGMSEDVVEALDSLIVPAPIIRRIQYAMI